MKQKKLHKIGNPATPVLLAQIIKFTFLKYIFTKSTALNLWTVDCTKLSCHTANQSIAKDD